MSYVCRKETHIECIQETLLVMEITYFNMRQQSIALW